MGLHRRAKPRSCGGRRADGGVNESGSSRRTPLPPAPSIPAQRAVGEASFPSRKGRGVITRGDLGPEEMVPPAVQFKVGALWFREPERVLFYGGGAFLRAKGNRAVSEDGLYATGRSPRVHWPLAGPWLLPAPQGTSRAARTGRWWCDPVFADPSRQGLCVKGCAHQYTYIYNLRVCTGGSEKPNLAGAEDKGEAGFLRQGCRPPPPALPLGGESQGPRHLELTAPSFADHRALGFPAARPQAHVGGPIARPLVGWGSGGSMRKGKRRGRRAGALTPLCSRGELSGAQDSNWNLTSRPM